MASVIDVQACTAKIRVCLNSMGAHGEGRLEPEAVLETLRGEYTCAERREEGVIT